MTQERQISLAPWIEAAFKQRAVSEAFFCYTSDSLERLLCFINLTQHLAKENACKNVINFLRLSLRLSQITARQAIRNRLAHPRTSKIWGRPEHSRFLERVCFCSVVYIGTVATGIVIRVTRGHKSQLVGR